MRGVIGRIGTLIGGLALVASLTACSGESGGAAGPQAGAGRSDHGASSDQAAPAGEGAPQKQTGVLTVDGRHFVVELTTCMSWDDEVLVSGMATETGTDVTGYLDGDVTDLDGESYGEIRLDIGATGPMQSMDEFISFGSSLGGVLEVAHSTNGGVITGAAWDADGSDLDTAVFEFNCG